MELIILWFVFPSLLRLLPCLRLVEPCRLDSLGDCNELVSKFSVLTRNLLEPFHLVVEVVVVVVVVTDVAGCRCAFSGT